MATIPVFASQARSAGTYISATAPYDGGLSDCTMQLMDPNWATTTSQTLTVGLVVEESFDSGVTWLVAQDCGEFTPPNEGKGGFVGCGFVAGEDGAGARIVRATMTLNEPWDGGVQGTVN